MTEHTNETLVELIQKTKKPKDLKDYLSELYQQNYPYILMICKRYSGYAELDDLMQESFFGLRIAADRYEPDQNIPFINYAAIWIRQVINRYIENCGNAIRIPSNQYRIIIKYHTTRKHFQQEHGRYPSDDEIMQLMGLKNKAQLKKIKDDADILFPLSIDNKVCSEDGTETFADIIPDPVDKYEELQDQIDDDIKKRDIWDEVDKLDDRKAEIIKKRFRDDMTLKQIGDSLGISSEAIRQSQDKALRRLSRSRKLRIYADDYLSAMAYSGTSLKAYMNTRTSSTEKTAIESYERTIHIYAKTTENRIAKMKRNISKHLKMESCK